MIMRFITKRIALSLLVGISFFSLGIAQDSDSVAAAAGSLYVVSAKAGGVNLVQGDATIVRDDGTSGPLLAGDRVKVGDIVSTGNNGRAEILMNPGSFVRLNNNSKFAFISTAIENLKVDVIKGNAIFEVFASKDFRVSVVAKDARFYLIKSGVYRVDSISGQPARLEVWKGRAQVADMNATTVKKGRAAVGATSGISISKFRKDKDDFEVWSKARAKMIAKSNSNLASRSLNRNILNGYRSNRWNCYDSVGLWVFNRRIRSYSFLPFGYGWRSPYGFGLGSYNEICLYPDFYRMRPRYIPGGGGGGTGGTGGTTATVPQANVERGTRNSTPPFERMQRTKSVRRSGRIRSTGGFPSGTGRSTRSNSSSRSKRSTGSSRSGTKSSQPRRTSSPVRTKQIPDN
jgi:hypothetical protein